MGGGSALEAPDAKGAWNDHIAVKVRRGQHVAAGSRMVRMCIGEKYPAGSLEIHVPHVFCPVSSFWGNVRRRARTGVQVSPGLTGPGSADKLRYAASHCGWGEVDRLGSHIIRREAGQLQGDSGGFARLRKAGQWRPSAYHLSLDTGAGEAQAMATIPIEASDDGRPGRQGPEGEGAPGP